MRASEKKKTVRENEKRLVVGRGAEGPHCLLRRPCARAARSALNARAYIIFFVRVSRVVVSSHPRRLRVRSITIVGIIYYNRIIIYNNSVYTQILCIPIYYYCYFVGTQMRFHLSIFPTTTDRFRRTHDVYVYIVLYILYTYINVFFFCSSSVVFFPVFFSNLLRPLPRLARYFRKYRIPPRRKKKKNHASLP